MNTHGWKVHIKGGFGGSHKTPPTQLLLLHVGKYDVGSPNIGQGKLSLLSAALHSSHSADLMKTGVSQGYKRKLTRFDGGACNQWEI